MEDSLTWHAPEYAHYRRSNDWFWAVGIIVVSIATLAFFLGNVLFGILVLLSAIILIFYTLRVPKDVEYTVSKKGVTVNSDLHPYSTIEAFWIETRLAEPKIILKLKKDILPYLSIPLHEDSVEEVGAVLREFLEEKEMQEPVSHKVMEYLGF